MFKILVGDFVVYTDEYWSSHGALFQKLHPNYPRKALKVEFSHGAEKVWTSESEFTNSNFLVKALNV